MLVQTLKEVPNDVFFAAKKEIDAIDFSSIKDSRAKAEVFSTSTAIHLRVHKPPLDRPMPRTIDEWSVITECVNHPLNYHKYPEVINLCNWVYKEVGGIEMGRIMIISLAAGGEVSPHIDPLDYFEQFSRFHIPFKTNSKVVFNNGSDSPDEHMPYKMLSRLNNRLMHALYNNSEENRIHLLVDIKQPNGNEIF